MRYAVGKDANDEWKKELYSIQIYLMPEMISHKRETYDLIKLLGDMGGIQGILISLLGVLVIPVSAHSFIIKAS